MVQADLPRDEVEVSEDDIAAVVAADWAFGLDLFRATATDENLMMSPYSIATALSMLYPGARGQTATEIGSALHVGVDDETLHDVRNHIDSALAMSPSSGSGDDAREPFVIRPANSAWGQGGFSFLDEYLTVLATHYGAGLRLVDFADSARAAAVMNEWAEEATEGRIEDLIPRSAIDEMTRLVLVNAIWFEASWGQQFDPRLTSDGTFTLLDGNQITVPMMRASVTASRVETDQFEAVRIPYAGDAAMVIALPNSGTPADLVAALVPGDLDLEWSGSRVALSLPRFEFESNLDLRQALQALGVQAAFVQPTTGTEDEADLTGMTTDRVLYVSDAFHKTFVAVDESGTEAAAATAIVTNQLSAAPMIDIAFEVDRPFLFWIEHSSTGEPLFMGQVTDPTAN